MGRPGFSELPTVPLVIVAFGPEPLKTTRTVGQAFMRVDVTSEILTPDLVSLSSLTSC